MSMTRREFGRVAIAGLPALGVAWRGSAALPAQASANPSTWGGVRVGLNVPYSLGLGNNLAAEEVLKQLVDLGIGSVELRAQPVENFLGSPTVRAAAEAEKARAAARAAGQPAPTPQQMAQGGLGGNRTPTPEQAAAADARKKEVRAWRLAASSAKVKDLRKMYEKAGVIVDVLKVDDLYTVSNEELDYFFQMARDLGARAISSELPQQRADTKRIGAFADKHKIFAAYHHHAQGTVALYEEIFTEAKYNGANIDIGHWMATHDESVLPFIATHHDRIPHIHVKDRQSKTNGGQNKPFGEGDTPVRQTLQAIRDNKWNVRPIIEFEYRVPEGSTRAAEIRKCLDYCQAALQA